MTDSLHSFLDRCFGELRAALDDQHAGFHWPVVATVDAQGNPQSRTVVLRAVDPEERTLRFHTDVRSPKIEQIEQQPQVAWLFQDHKQRLQIRATTHATVLREDPLVDAVWQAMGLGSRRCYLAPRPPSSTAGAEPTHNLPDDLYGRIPDPTRSELGRPMFCIVQAKIEQLEILSLRRAGHLRARFDFKGSEPAAQWIEP